MASLKFGVLLSVREGGVPVAPHGSLASSKHRDSDVAVSIIEKTAEEDVPASA
jgi:hypothetical protein